MNSEQIKQAVKDLIDTSSFDITNPVTITCGVYLLLKGDTVRYVGQSRNVVARVRAHAAVKSFDSVRFFPCSPDDLDNLEGLITRAIEPQDNKYHPAADHLTPPSELWETAMGDERARPVVQKAFLDGGLISRKYRSGACWAFRYSINGKRREMGLGSERNVSQAEAAHEVKRWRKVLALGLDPIEIRKTSKTQKRNHQ